MPPKCRRENIFWSTCSPYDNLSDEQSLYKYICPEGWDTWLPRMLGIFTIDIELNTVNQTGQNRTEIQVIWLDLANAYSSVPHHLIRMALEFFNFPIKVGGIIMKYFNSAFMKFTVKDYTTNWQALEISIMMGCVISSLLFILAMELITRCSKYVERSDEK